MAKFHKSLKRHPDCVTKHMITQKEVQFLSDFQKELNTQDTVGQADPRYWILRGKEKVYNVSEEVADGYSLINGDIVCDTYEEIIKHINENAEEAGSDIRLQKAKYALFEIVENGNIIQTLTDTEETNEWLHEHGYKDYDIVTWKEVDKNYENAMFLTEADAAEHLHKYGYNYDSEAHTYAMTAQRSPRVEHLIEFLQTADFALLQKLLPKTADNLTEVNVKIKWDTSGEDLTDEEILGLNLPTDITFVLNIPKPIVDAVIDTMDGDEVVNALSDEYGWCIEGFFVTATALEKGGE